MFDPMHCDYRKAIISLTIRAPSRGGVAERGLSQGGARTEYKGDNTAVFASTLVRV